MASFSVNILTKYENNNGSTENCLNLSKEVRFSWDLVEIFKGLLRFMWDLIIKKNILDEVKSFLFNEFFVQSFFFVNKRKGYFFKWYIAKRGLKHQEIFSNFLNLDKNHYF